MDPESVLVLFPAFVDFGQVAVGAGDPRTERFAVRNVGDVPRAVYGFRDVVPVSGPADAVFSVSEPEPVLTLGAGETHEFEVLFSPPVDGDWAGEIVLNDGIETLRVRGSGRAPQVAVRGTGVRSTPVGCETPFDVRIDNQGRERLLLTEPRVVGDDFALAVELPSVGIAPGQGFELALRFAPQWAVPSDATRMATLVLPTNDPTHPELAVPLSAFAWAGSAVAERFAFHPPTAVDLLFMVDTDGVMSAHVDKAQTAIGAMLDSLAAANVDLHAAVVTGADVCPSSVPAWVSGSASRWMQEQVLRDGLEGTSGAGSDALLAHAVAALEVDSAGGCLEGFRRSGALLHVVVISGGPDQGAADPDTAIEQLEAAHPEARAVMVSSVISTDSSGCGGVAYGEGYAEAAVRTAGEIVDLCAPDWSSGFVSIAEHSVADVDGGLHVSLVDGALVESIEVWVDGGTWTEWSVDSMNQTLVFPAASAPEPGSDVEVRYRLGVACD